MSFLSLFKAKPAAPVFTAEQMQQKLQDLGYYTGRIDGDIGPKTKAAIIAFKTSAGLQPTAYVGPITWQRLKEAVVLPWMSEIAKVFGLHEVRDNGALSAWLRSDGRTVGDPARIAWCGDAAETAIKLGLPGEPMPPVLAKNPYWARNWSQFGAPCGEVFGAAASFVRGDGGHIAFLVGISADGSRYRIRGGNQANTINDTWIAKNRLLALRWPSTCPVSLQRPAPVMNANGAPLSVNEA